MPDHEDVERRDTFLRKRERGGTRIDILLSVDPDAKTLHSTVEEKDHSIGW
jgi:hypothetical protein